jgi:type I restriction enzyme S subunit
MQKEKELIPQLRFSEFEDEWVKKTLFDISKEVAYGMNSAATKFDGENKYLRITDIDESSRKFVPNPLSSPDDKIETKYILKKDDIVFARTGASVGKSYLYDEKDGKLLFAGFLIKFNIINSNPYFVYLQTFRESYNKWVQVYSMRSGQPGLNAEEYKALKIKIPSLKEQQKIANFLTTVDNRIQTLEKKKILLEQYKKGVLQKIFKQELRFKDDDGNAFPEWKKLKLSDFLITTLREVDKPKNNYLAIGIRSHCKGTFQKPNSDPSKNSMKKLFVVQENDLIVNITFAWEGAIAIVKKEDEGAHVSHRFPTYTFNKDLVIHEFFKYVIIQKRFRNILDLISPGGAGRNRVMSKKEFVKIKWNIPCVKEQIKIANFLSAIDKNITLVNTKIEHTKAYKKGLLQQMFV